VCARAVVVVVVLSYVSQVLLNSNTFYKSLKMRVPHTDLEIHTTSRRKQERAQVKTRGE
jgi:hypothetical protein